MPLPLLKSILSSKQGYVHEHTMCLKVYVVSMDQQHRSRLQGNGLVRIQPYVEQDDNITLQKRKSMASFKIVLAHREPAAVKRVIGVGHSATSEAIEGQSAICECDAPGGRHTGKI
jgi:hypothetical protein